MDPDRRSERVRASDVDAIEKVTAADVQRVVKQYLQPDHATVVVIPREGTIVMRKHLIVLSLVAACGPKPADRIDADAARRRRCQRRQAAAGQADAADDPWAGKRSDHRRRRPSRRPPIELPAIEELQARATGCRSTSSRATGCRSSSMQLAIRAGRMHEPRARLGVVRAHRRHAGQGHEAARRRRRSRRRSTSSAARSPRTRRSRRRCVSCSVLSRNAGTCLELLPEMVIQPSFPEAELGQARQIG